MFCIYQLGLVTLKKRFSLKARIISSRRPYLEPKGLTEKGGKSYLHSTVLLQISINLYFGIAKGLQSGVEHPPFYLI